jgi:Na+-translocating ferredoxin:NAD+ oxidoreductase RnfG subunit
MSRFDAEILWLPSVVAVAIVAPALPALGATYLSVDAAQRTLFPAADSFAPLSLAPTAAQLAAIAAVAGEQAHHGELTAWIARREGATLGHVLVDNVIGREDFITYAVGIDTSGALTSVEILEYRESHGGEIRNRRWLAQFAGHKEPEELEFRSDIKNIAGATLSSEHVTNGVRWLLALWQQVLRAPESR